MFNPTAYESAKQIIRTRTLSRIISVQRVGLVVIAGLLLGTLLPNISFYLRKTAYQVFRCGAQVMLAHQTKDYAVLNSNNFLVKFRQEDQELAPVVLSLAEDYLQKAEAIMGVKHKARQIPLVLYQDEESLNESFGWSGDHRTVGVYWAGAIRLVSPRGWTKTQGQSVAELAESFTKDGPLAHELTHLLVDEITGGNYPRWLTEGLAQYVEQQITGFLLVEPVPDNVEQLYSFASLDDKFDEQKNQYLAYWQSLQAVRQLLADYGQEQMMTLLVSLGHGQDFATAFAENYGLAFSEFNMETILAR